MLNGGQGSGLSRYSPGETEKTTKTSLKIVGLRNQYLIKTSGTSCRRDNLLGTNTLKSQTGLIYGNLMIL
jgi:hypothetical protein